jgi:hypothetical protein
MIDWNESATKRRRGLLRQGIMRIIIIGGIVVAWVAYGVILKKKRDGSRNRDDIDSDLPPVESTSCVPLITTVFVIGACLIVAGVLFFLTVMGNCRNLILLSPGGIGCNFQAWSILALTASIAMCFMGSLLFYSLKCDSCWKQMFLYTQLIDS